MAVCSAAEAPLPQHGEMQRAARLGKHGPGIVMGHIADIIAVDLKQQMNKQNSYDRCMTNLIFLTCRNVYMTYLKKTNMEKMPEDPLPTKNHSKGFYSTE